ncbi:tetratricopeptide repeat protein [Aerosakkonemataceae cyanobacterium BLCC-F154]|uniref:Tetratricopeptide repeat protein n=1 Tax=Floridaenema fluviatile BLCC-F154 TaxID=3153640 RepID=A0ABV4Y6D0_9CYAN
MIQQRRNRGRILSDRGWDKLQDTLREKFGGQYTIEQLTELTDPLINPKSIKALSTDTVSKILRREEKVDKTSIEALFTALELKLEKDDITVNVQVSSPKLDPNFVGREGAIADLKNLIQQGAKAIVIHGKGGIGKTTLAWQFLHTQGFDKILDLRMAKETQNITSAESVIEEWLRRYFDEEPGREFGVTLDRLRQKLRNPNQRIGILIDNLEPALDEKGKCIEAHRKYVELFTALADPAVQSVTLITSRECLREAAVKVEYYRLEGLDIAAWEKFFNSRNIQIDTEVLNAMHQAYGGNAKAMQIFPGAIKEYNNSLAAYWQANKDDLLIERELEGLVVSQFDRLQKLDLSAYKLLCRLGCYRYQDVPRVAIEGLFCLLWDVPDNQRRVIKSLQDRSLVEFCNQEYSLHWLHPVIRAEAIKRLRESEDWETANQKAAEYWTGSVKAVETVEDALRALEAYYHYKDINDLESAIRVVIEPRKNQWITEGEGEYLGQSLYRLGLLKPISDVTNELLKRKPKSGYDLGRLYYIRGALNLLTGNLKDALLDFEQSKDIAKNIADVVKANRLELDALMTIGFCKRYSWDIEESLKIFHEFAKISKEANEADPVCAWCLLAFLYATLNNTKDLEIAHKFAEKAYHQIDTVNYLSLSIFRKGSSLVYLAWAYRYLNMIDKSLSIYNKAIEFGTETNCTQIQAKAKIGKGELYREQGDFTTALSHHTESIELLEKIGAKCDLAEAYYQFALTYQKMGDTEKSQPNFQQAIQLFTEMEAPKQVEKVQRAMENGENH